MGVFNKKNFNSLVFNKYVETVPRVKQNAFINAGILRGRPDLKESLAEQTGSKMIAVPMTGRIGGEPLNYDGSTDITADTIDTFMQTMVVVGRAKAWEELDFSHDITGGKDFMEDVGDQVADYWDDVDQATILAELKGLFQCTDDNFAEKHTLDITGETGDDANVGATTLNNSIQKAAGENKNLFRLAILHSQVATNLENLQILEYRKHTDAEGIQRDVALADWNGRTVLVDDDVPTTENVDTQGVYTLTVSTAATAGDKITIFGREYEFVANDATPTANQIKVGASGTATQQATNIQAKLVETGAPVTAGKYTITASSTTVVFTQKSDSYGYHKPIVVATQGTSGTLAVAMAETTPAVEHIAYTTYVMGEGAFDYVDCGAKVPSEMDRDPKVHGGKDILYTRQRKVFAPKGFSFTAPVGMGTSPTNAQLADVSAWHVVTNSDGTQYFDSRAIPFVRIVSKG